MNILGRNISFFANKYVTKELSELKVRYSEQQNQLRQTNLVLGSLRPISDSISISNPRFKSFPKFQLDQVYNMFYFSDTLFTVINTRTKACFRNGYETIEAFVRKCPECETEYQSNMETCEKCGADTVEPDQSQRVTINKMYRDLMVKANENDQNLQTVQEGFDIDLNVADDGYLLTIFRYEISSGKIKTATPLEIIKIDPRYIMPNVDPTGRLGFDSNGKEMPFCVNHRDSLQNGNEACSTCGCKLELAAYTAVGGKGKTEKLFYSKNEIHRFADAEKMSRLIFRKLFTDPLHGCANIFFVK